MIAQYSTPLIARELIAEETYKFLFKKPEGFSFIAGQYVFLDFAQPQFSDDRPSMRAMSIASAPQEDTLLFMMRSSGSAFKRNIMAMVPGDEIIVRGPLGHIALPDNIHRPVAFLIAGIGITPARSMIKHEEVIRSPRPITLIYSNRDDRNIALREELDTMQLDHFKRVYTVTRQEEWDGEKGRIDAEMITRNVDDINNQMYYVVGNGAFIDAMRTVLKDLGIANENVQFDNFG
jgi:ferredoxin-NADP reductase